MPKKKNNLTCGCGGNITVDAGSFGPVNKKAKAHFWLFQCDKCTATTNFGDGLTKKEAIQKFKIATRVFLDGVEVL